MMFSEVLISGVHFCCHPKGAARHIRCRRRRAEGLLPGGRRGRGRRPGIMSSDKSMIIIIVMIIIIIIIMTYTFIYIYIYTHTYICIMLEHV